MNLIAIYKCLSDETRLRILNLLSVSPLCVCHIQEVLGKSQVAISQHLAYLREHDLVTVQRYQTWMIYSLPTIRPAVLDVNLKCFQEESQEAFFQTDRKSLEIFMGCKTIRTLLDEGSCARITDSISKKPCTKQKATL